jgi:DNA polymerase-1
MTPPQKLVIIDGHALAFRSFHALSKQGFTSSNGEPTYAVYGFANTLLSMMQEQRPDYLAVAFDIGPSFRNTLFPEYKANRAETPEEFPAQLERIKQLVQVLGIPIYTAENYEADDVIGTLARQASDHGLDTLILTGDTDTLQLVDEQVSVLLANPVAKKMETTRYDEERVRERYKGLNPDQLADLRGLKGDASDNIPGVRGIGETGAINLLNEFGTVEGVFAHLEDVNKRYRKHLEGQQEEALLSKKLAIIACDTPVTLDITAASRTGYQRAEAIQLFQELEFRSLVDKLPPASDETIAAFDIQAIPQANPVAQPTEEGDFSSTQLRMFDLPAQTLPATATTQSNTPPLGDYQAITTEEELQQVLTALHAAPAFAFDTECTSLQPFQGELVGISLATEPGHAWYIPVGHVEGEQLPKEHVLHQLRDLFADSEKPKYAHHAKFDMEVLIQAGLEVRGIAFDTMIAAGLLGKRMGLKDLAFYDLRIAEPMTDITELIGRGSKQRSFAQVPVAQATPYAAADADMTLRLVPLLREQLQAQPHAQDIFERIEMPLIPILVDMERTGIGFDIGYMRELSKRLQTNMQELEQQIYDHAGQSFNINSGQQLNTILFDKLQLPTEGLNKTSSGRYSLNADALEKLSGSHEIVRLILEHRHLVKLTSTYVDVLPTLVNPATKRVHTSFNQMGTATGRLASSSPNLQNIPVRTEVGNAIRRAFIAAPGCTFIAADYSQIELRVLAHITQDPNLLQAFQEGQDIHSAMAAHLFHMPLDRIDKNQRRIAKTTVFGIIYGISSFGLAQRTEMNRSEAQELIDTFFKRFPRVRNYMDATLEQGRRDGYVSSLFGRRRAVPDLNSKGARRSAAEREAINSPIQSTAADIMKLAMLHVARALQAAQCRAKMVLQVHDELIFDTPLDEVEQVQNLVRTAMEQVYTLNVPLKVDIEAGDNWQQMHEVKMT